MGMCVRSAAILGYPPPEGQRQPTCVVQRGGNGVAAVGIRLMQHNMKPVASGIPHTQ